MNSLLPSELENQIQAYQDYFFGKRLTWDYVRLEAEVMSFFDQYGHDPGMVDALFNRFATIWGFLYQLREFARADDFWDIPLGYANQWEQTRNARLHKGTPYYFRAMAAVAGGNIDRGFLLFHQALDEDERRDGGPVSTGPAWSFVTLDYSNVYQAAFKDVKSRADWLDQLFGQYNASGRGSFTLADFRSRVLNQPGLREATYSFTHALFKSKNLIELPEPFRFSTFASQIELDTLFNFCRVGEVWLKYKQPPSNRYERELGGQLLRFFQSRRWVLTPSDLTSTNSVDFDLCLSTLLDGQKGPLPRSYQPLEADLILIYIMRNQAGHGTVSSTVVCNRFSELLQRILFGLFSVGERLF
jgi:hypothetical protein